MERGAIEFEELAKLILGVVVLIFIVLLLYLLKDKIIEAIGALQ